jgi:integrase/recombinase XerD
MNTTSTTNSLSTRTTTPLRQKYVRDLTIRGKAQRTIQSYTYYVADLARFHHQSPDQLSYDQVADWLFHLKDHRQLAASSVNIAVNAVRFLYQTTLGRDTIELFAKVPRMKRETKRAHAYSVNEVEAILNAPCRLRDLAFLRLVYGCGLRLSEAVGLRARGDIDRARMQVRVQGKGAKERVLPMSLHLLEVLERYWRAERSGKPGHDAPWLFLGEDQHSPMHKATGQNIYYRALKKSQVRGKGGIHVLRHSFASHLIESGVEITLVQRLLGHTSLLTTARYLHVTRPRLDRVRSALDLIDHAALQRPVRT